MKIFSRVLAAAASLKITVAGLGLLFVLTFWGTLAQVHHGLYRAQKEVFESWFFLAGGFLPLPGGRCVLWILFVNLLAAGWFRFRRYRKAWGLWLIHGGLLLYFVTAFVLFHFSEEYHVTLAEGEWTNVASSHDQWELSFWDSNESPRSVTAWDMEPEGASRVILPEKNIQVDRLSYFVNAQAWASNHPGNHRNASRLVRLDPLPWNPDVEKNIPGGRFRLTSTISPEKKEMLLFGGEIFPRRFVLDGNAGWVQLRRRRSPLPVKIKLLDVVKEDYPGVDKAKSYHSDILVSHQGLERPVTIRMNKPFRFGPWTFYQAAYARMSDGTEQTTLAAVRNRGRSLPYVACAVTFLGLCVHFGMTVWRGGSMRKGRA